MTEYAAYYERRSALRTKGMIKDQREFERVAVHAEEERRKKQEEDANMIISSAGESAVENEGAAEKAARDAVLAMSEEEIEAALSRHEERQAMSKYALDLKPEKLFLSANIRHELMRAVEKLSDAKRRRLGPEEKRRSPKKRSGHGEQDSQASYFNVPRSVEPELYDNAVLARMKRPLYQRMLKQRKKLPAYQMSCSIADTLLAPKVSMAVISGETGCGKTTQVPRILIENAAKRGMGRINILVAQPRRIAAIGVAERVGEEGGTGKMPGESGCDVGYHIRHDRRVGDDANIVFATTGIVLRILAGDALLQGVDVVIVDEVHERSADGDFLLTVLRELVNSDERGPASKRPLKLILMSATVDADFFVNYLKEAAPPNKVNSIPVLHIKGVAHPVRDFYLEDAIDACSAVLSESNDVFDLTTGKGWSGRGKKWSNKNGRRELSDEEELIRSNRYEHVDKKYASERCAEFVTEFDVRAKVSEKESHLKSLSSGDLPLGLAFHLVFFLDKKHRPKDGGDGAVLVFLPGYDDIAKLNDAFKAAATGVYADEVSNLHVITLHGSMPTSEQREIFRKPPGNKRKVVLSTNVAESSITIDDVVYCLDLGKHKEKTYDPIAGICCLLPTWISKASARQRRGRAGRVRAGECFHLYPSWYVKDGDGIDNEARIQITSCEDNDPAFDGDVKLQAFALPEMLRTPLDEVCLRAKYLGLAPIGYGGVERFLSKCPSPPGPLSLYNAMEALGPSDMHLLEANTEALTPMGKAVASVPVPPRIGLALMLSNSLGCEEEMLTVCSLLSGRSPFYAPMEMKAQADRAKRSFAEDVPSDLYASVRAYDAWEQAESKREGWSFCRSNFISRQAMLAARSNRRQLSREVEASKLGIFAHGMMIADGRTESADAKHDSNRLWERWGRVMGVLAAAFGSHLARLDHGGTGKCRCPVYTKGHGRVRLFPSSINSPDGAAREIASRGTSYYIHRWGIYMEKVRNSGGICLYDINEVSAFAVLVCASGERTYGKKEMPNDFLQIDATNGKVIWSVDEVSAMTTRREKLVSVADSEDVSEVERVGARVEMEDIENRLGIVDLIKKGEGRSIKGADCIDDRVIRFVVSALETNGGMYSMSALRRMMKADMELYNAMGPVRTFAAAHPSILSLDKISGKWMFVLKPGAKESLLTSEYGPGTGGRGTVPPFYGPKQWVYFDMENDEQQCIRAVRRSFREAIDSMVSGEKLLHEEQTFLSTLGWALTEEWTKSN